MRAALWNEVARRVPAPATLLDLGCGTGIDAVHFAQAGYAVTAIDASPEMVKHTRARVARANANVRVENIGAQELAKLHDQTFNAIYSDLGPLNCVADLRSVSRQCATHLKPNGYLIISVMARICPWEIVYFSLRWQGNQATRRLARAMVPVQLENGIVWTRYYDPREFLQALEPEFRLVTYRALNLFLPPPYLNRWYQRAGVFGKPLAWLDNATASLPVLRDMGDHFLMILQK